MTWGAFSIPMMVAALFLRGLGQGAIGVPSISAGYAAVPREQIGLATTAANIVQRVGGPTGTTIMGIVLSMAMTGHAGSGAFRLPVLALSGLQLLVLASASRLPLRIHADELTPARA
jgi:hypothetical protein